MMGLIRNSMRGVGRLLLLAIVLGGVSQTVLAQGNVNDNGSGGCPGDTNRDGVVDPLDAGYVLARFGCAVGDGDADCDASDANGDGEVDPLDSGFVLARLGVCPNIGNDNEGDNANDNTPANTNVNDNVGSECTPVCPGETEVHLTADLEGEGTGTADYKYVGQYYGLHRFELSIKEVVPGSYPIIVSGVTVGTVDVGEDGTGGVEWDSDLGTFPVNFPEPVCVGDPVAVGSILFGTWYVDCGGNANDNTADNENGNTAGNENDNAAGNANENIGDNANVNDNIDTHCTPLCPGETEVHLTADLEGEGTGTADYHYVGQYYGLHRFELTVKEVVPGSYPIIVSGVTVGTIEVGAEGTGEVFWETELGNFPANFPQPVCVGDPVAVGTILSGTWYVDCGPSNGNDNTEDNVNDNADGNVNDNAGGNTNDNGDANDNVGDNANDNVPGNVNTNDNTGGVCQPTCPLNGRVDFRSDLTGTGDATANYSLLTNGREKFDLSVTGAPQGSYAITVSGVVVGTVSVNAAGDGEVDWDSQDGNFPSAFPLTCEDDAVSVGSILSGNWYQNCSN